MANSEFRSALRLPSHPNAAALARAYVQELSLLAALPAEQADLLVRAAAEACAEIVRHALAPGASEPLELAGILTPRALTLTIRERGEPFDPTLVSGSRAGALPPIPAPAWDRLRRAVDVAHWSNEATPGWGLTLRASPHRATVRHLPAEEGS